MKTKWKSPDRRVTRAIKTIAAIATLATPLFTITQAHAANTLEVVDFGGAHHQLLLDANKDAFVVDAYSGQLYVYDAARTIAPDTNRVYKRYTAPIPGVRVIGNQLVLDDSKIIGEIMMDQQRSGLEFGILGYRTGSITGYLDVDFNRNYRGVFSGDKTDPRIEQADAIAFVKTYKALKGQRHFLSLGALSLKENRKKFPILLKTVKYTFKAPTSGDYQVVLRDFNPLVNDLDLRLVELSTGRILGSSYSTKSGELVGTQLRGGQQYGVVVSRQSSSKTVPYVLSVKKVSEQQNAGYMSRMPYLQPGESRKITGTVRPSTRFELVSRFPEISDASGDVNAGIYFDPEWDSSHDTSNDSSGDASWDTSGDTSWDVSDDTSIDSLFHAVTTLPWFIPDASADIADVDLFFFYSTPGSFNYFVTNKGGTTITRVLDFFSSYLEHVWVGESPSGVPIDHSGYGPIGIRLSDDNASDGNASDDTIEYEVLISPAN